MTRGPIPTVGDLGGPHQSPKTTIYTPENYHFCSPGLPPPLVVTASIPPTAVSGLFFIIFLQISFIWMQLFYFHVEIALTLLDKPLNILRINTVFVSMYLLIKLSLIEFQRRLIYQEVVQTAIC